MNTSHVFHEIYLHIIWHVKYDKATLKDNIEKLTHRFLIERCAKTKGVTLHGLGGTDTHIHLAVDIEPAVTISDLVKNLKGGSSHDLNTELRRKELQWQRGYGVVSFGRKNLPWVLEYIANQRQHHAAGTAQVRLENAGDCDDGYEEDEGFQG